MYHFAIGTTKISVLTLFYRIFETPLLRKIIVGTAILVAAWLIGIELAAFLICRPIRAWWTDRSNCGNLEALIVFVTCSNIILDLWIFSLPLPTLLRLQALKDRRLSLCFLFSFGLGTCLLSIARLVFFIILLPLDWTCKSNPPDPISPNKERSNN